LDKTKLITVLNAFESGTPQTLLCGHDHKETQCIPLGGDLMEDVILTKAVPNSLPNAKLMGKQPSFLCISNDAQCLVLELRALESENGLSYWKIQNAYWRQNKRWQPRVCFRAYHAPKVTIVREFQSNITAELHDLSESACALSFWNKDLKHDFDSGSALSAHIKFNEHFSLNTDFDVIAASFIRQPCCHTRLRLRFRGLSDVQQSQLGMLIENLSLKFEAA